MVKPTKMNVNDAILQALQKAKVPTDPILPVQPLPEQGGNAPADQPTSQVDRQAAKGQRGRTAPDRPARATNSSQKATTTAFTLYGKDSKRIEEAITALRREGITEGNNRSAMVRMAIMNLPTGGGELATLFRALQTDLMK